MKDVVLREIPKTMMHTIIEMNSNNTNAQDAKEQYEIERRYIILLLEVCQRMN